MGIPERLVEIREKNGYTRKKLSEELKKPYTTITKYETGEREPGHSYIVEIAKKFNVSTDYILGIEKAPEPKELVSEAEVERLAVQLYQALLRAGLVEEGQELTERQMRAIEGICDVLSVVFDDAN